MCSPRGCDQPQGYSVSEVWGKKSARILLITRPVLFPWHEQCDSQAGGQPPSPGGGDKAGAWILHTCWAPIPEILFQAVWSEAQEYVFKCLPDDLMIG